jgi:hypothetical protein
LRCRGGSSSSEWLPAPLLGSSCRLFFPLLLQFNTFKIRCTLSLAFFTHTGYPYFLLVLRSLHRHTLSLFLY